MVESVFNFVLCTIIAFIGTLAFRIAVPVIAFYAREVLGSTALDVGLLMSSFMAARAIAATISGHVYGHRRLVVIITPLCFSLNAIVALLYLTATDVVHLFILRFLQGLLNGFAWVTIQIVLGATVPQRFRATAYAIYFASGSLGIVLANQLFGYLANRPLIEPILISSTAFITTALLSLFISYPASTELGVERPRRRLSVNRDSISIAVLISLVVLVMCIRAGISVVFSDVMYVYLYELFGYTKSFIGLFLAYATGIGVALSIPFSLVADRLSERTAFILSIAIAVLGLILLPTLNSNTILLSIALLSVAGRVLIPITRRIAMTYIGARGIGYINASGNIGVLTGSALFGYLYDVYGITKVILHGVSIAVTAIVFVAPITIISISTLLIMVRKLKA